MFALPLVDKTEDGLQLLFLNVFQLIVPYEFTDFCQIDFLLSFEGSQSFLIAHSRRRVFEEEEPPNLTVASQEGLNRFDVGILFRGDVHQRNGRQTQTTFTLIFDTVPFEQAIDLQIFLAADPHLN